MIKMKQIRILHVVKKMGFGGIESFLMSVYRNIDKKKIQFDFLVNEPGEYDDEIKKLGGRIYIIDYLGKVGPIKYKRELKKFFASTNYGIVHSHYGQITGLILEVAKKCNVKKRIAHSHSISIIKNNFILTNYKKYLQTKINKNDNVLLSCSLDASKFLYKEKWKDSIIIPNGIDVELFKYNVSTRNKIRSELNISKNDIILGHVGRFCYEKNQSFLIELIKRIPDSRYKLLLIGNGSTKDGIIKEIKLNKLESRVKILDSTKEISNYYSAMDIFVFPSFNEGLGIVAVEAQANGLPCVLSNGIPKEVKINDNVFFEKLDLNDWIDCINKIDRERIIDNKVDISNYNIINVCKNLEKIYFK